MQITNRKAFFNFDILDRFEAGITLYGQEVKAIRLGHADLTGSFVKIIGNEAFLLNAKIFPYENARSENYEETRTRKLLLHKSEIISLKSKMDGQNLSIVPISLYLKSHLVKIELALGHGKKKFDKKQAIKKRDLQRDLESELSS